MFKRIVSLLLCFAIAASFLPANAFPARAEEMQEEPTAWVHMEWTENGETKQLDFDDLAESEDTDTPEPEEEL